MNGGAVSTLVSSVGGVVLFFRIVDFVVSRPAVVGCAIKRLNMAAVSGKLEVLSSTSSCARRTYCFGQASAAP